MLVSTQVNDSTVPIPYGCPADCGKSMSYDNIRDNCDEEMFAKYHR